MIHFFINVIFCRSNVKKNKVKEIIKLAMNIYVSRLEGNYNQQLNFLAVHSNKNEKRFCVEQDGRVL